MRDLQPPREFARARLKTLTGNLERNLVNEIGITEQHSVRKNTIIMYDNVMQQFKRIMKTDPIKCSPAHLDQTLVRYFDKLYLEGAAFTPENDCGPPFGSWCHTTLRRARCPFRVRRGLSRDGADLSLRSLADHFHGSQLPSSRDTSH